MLANGHIPKGRHIIEKLLYLMQLKKQEESEEELRKSNRALKETTEEDGSD